MNSVQGYRCALHQSPFEFFCQRCLQPVCKQCTIIGPHHTQIHVLSKINIAYERKVQQIKSRIQDLVQTNRQKVFKIIAQLNFDIEQIQVIKTSVDAQNNRQKERMLLTLTKQYENNRNILHLYRETLVTKSNQINDLGFRYKNIQTAIQLLGSHQKILHQLKELHDRLKIVLEKNVPLSPYAKELTDIRLKLKEIDCLKEFYDDKIMTISLIIKKTNSLSNQITSPKIDYEELLVELNKSLSSIKHLICHFCGIPFSFDDANKECQKNSGGMNLNFGAPSATTAGYCTISPDTNKLGTNRHFFGQPTNLLSFYGPIAQGSFKVELDCILLKAKALIQQKKIKITKEFEKNDKENIGYCEKIVFDYIFIEILGLTERQKLIITSISHPYQTNPCFMSYTQLLEQFNKIDI